ncbi:MAG: citrate (Si)-synthase, partial [Alphaproteobacteria bacterium]|nr:citrate (Si)-synthase [Alphaproteobacteria bacterium]
MSNAAPQPKPQKTVTLTDNETGKTYQFPVLDGSVGPRVIDIRKLYAETGMFTFDPGFTSTAACESGLTYIDGDKGVLLHRGYSIKELALKSDFIEVCHLLLYGDLPDAEQKKEFLNHITHHTMVHEQMQFFFRGF